MATQKQILGTDIALIDGDIAFDFNQDFKKISGKLNLAQAFKNRLNTKIDELPYYEEYGSLFPLLTGERNDNLLVNRATGYVYKTVAQDPRVADIRNIKVNINKDYTNVEVTIIPISENNAVNLVFNL